MKKIGANLLALLVIFLVFIGCARNKETSNQKVEKTSGAIDTSMIVVAKDIITEVIVNKVPDGDPWEYEKIAGYNGKDMINKMSDDQLDMISPAFDIKHWLHKFTQSPADVALVKDILEEVKIK